MKTNKKVPPQTNTLRHSFLSKTPARTLHRAV